MYPLGFLPFFYSLVPEWGAVGFALVIPILVLALWFYTIVTRSASSTQPDDAPVYLPGSSLLHILPFFHHRFDFINQGFQLAGHAIYQFTLLRTPVIVLSGEAARRDFFQAKDLDLNAGFKFLSGAIPMMPGVTSNLEARRIALIHKRLVSSQTTERLTRLLPQILEDSRRTLDSWGFSGTFDPFERLPELIFQTTVRCLAFGELADDRVAVARLKSLYDTLDTATTPATVLLPWLPGPSAVRRLLATKRIYDIIGGALDARTAGGVARDDTPQMLIDAGDERMIIIGFIMGLLVAGARSTGTTASWLITFLSGHPHWKAKATEEARRLVAKHAEHARTTAPPPPQEASPQARRCASDLSALTATLSSIPLSAWETETPVLDALIRETLRVAEPHVAMRQYLPPTTLDEKAEPLYLGGKAVPPGAFVMYPFSDVHLSPEVYKDPWRWDPGRTEMSLKAPYAYVGMGAGSTVCLGKRLATLELKLITALFVLGFDELRAVDGTGAPLAALPRPNWNDILTCRPAAGSCYVRFGRTVAGAGA
ncbi:Lanosterol 14-alpha demethylase [Trametes pubescens]|uniref:Lanosterol 14-alpha demethylase n=1 Tax=Trametes pubescens TaxID=154538 RepID=A0A1M2VIT6_TRAPU|nr:Lanosterol 14-alpha demethylase [Trametes pubescens]